MATERPSSDADEYASEGDNHNFDGLNFEYDDWVPGPNQKAAFFQEFTSTWATLQLQKGTDLNNWKEVGQSIMGNIKKGRDLVKIRTSKSREDLQKFLDKSRAKLKSPPFIRTIDKIAFMAGIALLLGTQYFILAAPQFIHWFYIFSMIPLILWRFFHYHGLKFHYFLLDYCYFCQFVYLIYFLGFWNDIKYFKLIFSLSTGPLGFAVVAWRNSLVFHDLDKVTTLFIHMFPPCVSYCLRWKNPELFNQPEDEHISFKDFLVIPLVVYSFWQIFYLIRTELLDRSKIKQDKYLVTSKIWMSEIQPHFIYNFFHKRGVNVPPLVLLVGFQYVYTIIFLIPAKFAYEYRWFNVVYVLFIFFFSCWSGACYYFDIFSRKYTQRLERFLKSETQKFNDQKEEEEKPEDFARSIKKKHRRQGACPKYASFIEWCVFMTVFTICFLCLIIYVVPVI
mmetsp:Transcript_10830/g.11909  ORF Transcript_10830/g.11909 Transcript_10830/m.11909 type:complete len:450 (+) Transcript_10830:20-1369(+)